MSNSVGAVGSVPSIRAMRLVRPGWGSKRSTSRPVVPRYCSSRSTLRTSWPDSTVPWFTQALRISCWRRSTASRSYSELLIALRSSRRDSVHVRALLGPALGLARQHHVLEVGEGLALRHHPPVLARKDLVRELLHGGRADRLRGA